MDFRFLLVPSLIFLGAAAAPQGDCSTSLGGSGQTLATSQDLAGRPSTSAGLAGQVYAALPSTEVAPGCSSPLPSMASPYSLRSDSGDVLHGLPMPDSLRPISEPARSPLFQ